MGGAAVVLAASAVHADEVTDWNSMLMVATRAQSGNDAGPGPISRAGAILHASIYDAVNSIDRSHAAANFLYSPAAGTDKRAAAAAAGYTALSQLYGSNPALQAQFDTLYQAQMNAIAPGAGRDAGVALGQTAATDTFSLRAADGHDVPGTYTEQPGPGNWRSNYQPFVPAWGPQWGSVTPWVMSSGDQFRPAPAPSLTSQQYTDAWNEVYWKGKATGSTRTAEETEIAWFWGNDRDGTYKPPGQLNRITQIVSQQQFAALSDDERLVENARLFALTNIGMADAAIVAWDCKYDTDSDFWRPIAGIREADTDGNPDTAADLLWEPLSHAGIGGGAFTPPFPAYMSGHATFGAVHAALMAAFFGTDDISFTLDTDDADAFGATRTFDSFSEAAWENALSRIYLGVHWRFDAEMGNLCGTDLGRFIAANYLLPVPAPSAGALLAAGGLTLMRRRRR